MLWKRGRTYVGMGHRKIEEAFTRFVKLTTASNHKM